MQSEVTVFTRNLRPNHEPSEYINIDGGTQYTYRYQTGEPMSAPLACLLPIHLAHFWTTGLHATPSLQQILEELYYLTYMDPTCENGDKLTADSIIELFRRFPYLTTEQKYAILLARGCFAIYGLQSYKIERGHCIVVERWEVAETVEDMEDSIRRGQALMVTISAPPQFDEISEGVAFYVSDPVWTEADCKPLTLNIVGFGCDINGYDVWCCQIFKSDDWGPYRNGSVRIHKGFNWLGIESKAVYPILAVAEVLPTFDQMIIDIDGEGVNEGGVEEVAELIVPAAPAPVPQAAPQDPQVAPVPQAALAPQPPQVAPVPQAAPAPQPPQVAPVPQAAPAPAAVAHAAAAHADAAEAAAQAAAQNAARAAAQIAAHAANLIAAYIADAINSNPIDHMRLAEAADLLADLDEHIHLAAHLAAVPVLENNVHALDNVDLAPENDDLGLQNGVLQNGALQNGALQNGALQNGVLQNDAD